MPQHSEAQVDNGGGANIAAVAQQARGFRQRRIYVVCKQGPGADPVQPHDRSDDRQARPAAARAVVVGRTGGLDAELRLGARSVYSRAPRRLAAIHGALAVAGSAGCRFLGSRIWGQKQFSAPGKARARTFY